MRNFNVAVTNSHSLPNETTKGAIVKLFTTFVTAGWIPTGRESSHEILSNLTKFEKGNEG